MDSKKLTDDNSPGKTFRNILLEKATHGKLKYPFNCDSPFGCMPSVSTPPSRVVLIRNPFEGQLTKRLHHTVLSSPSVFSLNVANNSKTEEKFRWGIEEISNLNPAEIDETTINQFECVELDPDMERNVQAKIDTFFNAKYVVPSPFDASIKNVPLISDNVSPISSGEQKQSVDGTAQTILTLPPKLPEQVEAILKPYFSYTVDQQRDGSSKNTSLYRRLFEYEEQDSPTSILTSPAPSYNLSPVEFSPYNENQTKSRRNFESPHDNGQILDCNLSPIPEEKIEAQVPVRSIITSRLDFAESMSIDTSMNLVPDTLDQMPSNRSEMFDNVQSPIPEVLSDSSINWDMEYKHVSLASPKSQNTSENEMDVSNSNTPKSKIFISQRKKLSDSFLKIEETEDDKENLFEATNGADKKIAKSLFARNNSIDAGYHTGGLTMSEESWSSSHLFASTPTSKRHT